jgi:hypothetical protein
MITEPVVRSSSPAVLDAPAMVAAPIPPRVGLAGLALPGVRSLKKNWRAIVGLQAMGLVVVIAYYAMPSLRGAFDWAAAMKVRGGYVFSAIMLAIVCGIGPEIAKTIFGVDRTLTRARLRHMVFNMLVFGFLGIMVDAFYRLLADVIGTQVTVGTVAAKVAIDQFVYTPLLSATTIALAYTWREYRYSIRRTLGVLGRRWYLRRVVILLLPCWAYWIPMTSLMYSLPAGLTFVFGALASAAASLLLTSVAGEGDGSVKPEIRNQKPEI